MKKMARSLFGISAIFIVAIFVFFTDLFLLRKQSLTVVQIRFIKHLKRKTWRNSPKQPA
jgi:hypothetical protein